MESTYHKKRTINVLSFNVDIYDFGYASFFYPSFNGNAEYPVTKKGYKDLTRYLRNILWIKEIRKNVV